MIISSQALLVRSVEFLPDQISNIVDITHFLSKPCTFFNCMYAYVRPKEMNGPQTPSFLTNLAAPIKSYNYISLAGSSIHHLVSARGWS